METNKADGYDVTPLVTRCKFYCQSMKKTLDRVGTEQRFLYEYEFFVVYSGSEENKQYFAYTPSGTLKISAFRDDLFVPGAEYYLDVRPAIVSNEVSK